MVVLASSVAFVSLATHPVAAQPEQTAAAASQGFEEIVVTARRKSERVQSVPLAISAFSQADLDKRQIHQISDLAREVPSLNVVSSTSDPNAPSSGFVRLRGLPGTVVYFNDVPIGSVDPDPQSFLVHATTPGFIFDLDHLEVDKGPQGTLFGKNSIGGLISYQSKRPVNNFEGYGQITLGDYNERAFEAAVNIPIIQDKLLIRIAGQTQQRDGYTKDLSTGKDLDNIDYYTWRTSVILRPSDDFENLFVYDGYLQHTNGSSIITRYVNPDFDLGGITLGQIYPNITKLLVQQQRIGARAELGSFVQQIGKDYFYGFTDIATWDISDNLTLKNIAAARIFKQLVTAEYASLGLPLLSVGDPVNNTGKTENLAQYSEEIQLQGRALQEKLSWVLGGYLDFHHPLGENGQPNYYVGFPLYYYFHNVSRSQAVFAHGIYDLSDYVDGLKLTAGYRYTWDYASVLEYGTSGINRIIRDAAGNPLNCVAASNTDRNCAAGGNAHYSSYGWNVSLDEQITPETLLYVRAGNAYRPGAINPTVPPAYVDLKPEHVTDVELGVKSDWELFGSKIRTNADVFHTDYKSIQVSQLIRVISGGVTTAQLVTLNAASAELQGAELDATIVPIEGVELSPHASYIFAQYDKYPAAFGGQATEKPPFFYVPKWQYGVTGTYHLPVDQSWGDISASLSYSWTGHQYVTVIPGEIANIIPSYENIDFRIDWTDMFGEPIDVAAFVSNLTDNTHITSIAALYTSLGFTSATYNAPRMFGFSVKYRFGGASPPEQSEATYTPPPVTAARPAVPNSYLVFFDFNRSDLTPQAMSIVDQAAKNASSATISKIEVTGHTDTVGSDAYNMRLSRRRAEVVASQLEKDGIPSSEIEIIAKGKRDLLVPTADGVREPQNRRVQILYAGGVGS
jgi:iron complex outermembrane receptor protein